MDPATTQATAKAVEESAKTAGKALDTLNKVIGDVPSDLVGVLGGAWLYEQHICIKDKLRRRTEQLLRERDVQELAEVSPNIAIALISGAREEADEELAELWARLLANALDPNLGNVRHSFIDAVKKMDSLDALVLYHIYKSEISVIRLGAQHLQNRTIGHQIIASHIKCTQDQVEASLRNLKDLSFFDEIFSNPGWYANVKSREFMRASYPDIEPKAPISSS